MMPTRRSFIAWLLSALGLSRSIRSVAATLPGPVPPVIGPPPVGRFKPMPVMGVNADEFANTHLQLQPAFLDRSRASQPWVRVSDGLQQVGVDGYPTGGGQHKSIMSFDNPAIYPGVPNRYVCETTRTGWNFYVAADSDPMRHVVRTKIRRAGTPDGVVERVEFSLDYSRAHAPSFFYVCVNNTDAHPWRDGIDTFYLCRADHEALLLSGRRFTDDFVAGTAPFGLIRFMNWCGTNGQAGEISDLSQWTPLSYATWGNYDRTPRGSPTPGIGPYNRVPVEILAAACNESECLGWFNMPHRFTTAAFVIKMNALLKPELRYKLEDSNEAWNGKFGQNGVFRALYDPPPVQTDDPEWGNHGFHAGLMAMAAVKADNFSGRVLPFLGNQATNGAILRGVFAGVRAAMDAVGDPRNALYDPVLAARFKSNRPLGTLFTSAGGAHYLAGGMFNNMIEASGNPNHGADLAKVRSWRDDASHASDQLWYDQHYTGDKFSFTPDYVINNFAAKFADEAGLIEAENMLHVAYEGGPGHESIPDDMQAYTTARRIDPRMRALQRDVMLAALTSFDVAMQYATTVTLGQDYSQQEYAWHRNDPKFLGSLDVASAPPAAKPLTIAVTNSGSFALGRNPSTVAIAKGGRGVYRFVWEGLASGRASDGFSVVSGVLTGRIGTKRGKVTVYDEYGQSASATFDQIVTPAVDAFRYIKVSPTANYSGNDPNSQFYRLGCAEVALEAADGSIIAYAQHAAASTTSATGNNPVGRVCDGSTTSSYITNDNGGAVNGGEFTIDLTSEGAARPVALRIYTCPESANFRMRTGTISIARDGGSTFHQAASPSDMQYTDNNTGYCRVPLKYPPSP